MNKPTISSNIDGNAFMVIGAVSKVLKQNNQPHSAVEFVRRSSNCASYDELLRLTYEYVEWV